jgi:hypothetical protein
LARSPARARQRISWDEPPSHRSPLNPAAAQNFGLDSTARALQKAELKMAYCRRLCTALLGLSAALWASPGLAQTSTGGTTSTSTTLATGDFTLTLQQPDGNSWSDLSTTDAATYLNQARCQCAAPVQILVQMVPASISKLSSLNVTGTGARLYVGNDCNELNSDNVGLACPMLGTPLANIASLSAGSWSVPTTVDKLFAAVGDCSATQSTTIWLWLDSTGHGYPDSSVSGSSAPSLSVALDGTPPAAPADIKVEGGEEALTVSWGSVSTTTFPDLAGYLVFCMRGSDLQVFVPSYYTGSVTSSGDGSAEVLRPTTGSQYLTGQILCSSTPPIFAPTGVSSADPNTTATEIGPPPAFKDLDPNYLCSGLVPTTQDSIRIGGLQNGAPYQVGVASVDTHGNASPIQSAFFQRPVPTIDFYQAYRQAGGQSPGGYCSLAGRGARLGAISFLAGSGLLALIIFRRRRRARRALSRGLPFLLVALAAGSAQAQVVTHEETDEMSSEQRANYRTPKEWAMELRFGPYAPDVDSGIGSSATATYNGAPYKTVFGGKRHLMSQLEFDWQFFQAFGSLAVGAAIGYYNVSAKAFTADANGNCVPDKTTTSGCELSGDTTSLRLIPVSALLVYRWDVAAERWSIPFVPYVKLGLNYTFWQVNDGNGNVPSYAGGHGSGGTLGWQAAAGMSLLLDILDSEAARGLDMETGVNHSYVFFEWNNVDASGLGMSNRLHVGDSRWVLGLMFEF